MNRTTALFLALAILLAHTLAIHQGSEQNSGRFAPPYDQAHVAYRLARNFAEQGNLAWDASMPAAESYPSWLWVGVAVIPERLYLQVTTFCQWIGMLSAFLCVLVLARFSPERLAGVIAPLLFVVSGGIAAAAANGMETATFALLVVAAFLAFERRRPVTLAILLALTCATRPEGALFAGALFVLEVAGRRHRGRVEERPAMWRPYLAPLVVTIAMVATRRALVGQWVSPWTASLFDGSGLVERWIQGLQYLRDFLVGSGWTILVVFPLWYAMRGSLLGLGRRALLLAIFWAALVVASGGDSLPYAQAMAPMFAILMISIQEAMTLALDSHRRAYPSVAWGMFLAALAFSALASKYPGDLGPLRIEGVHRLWMQSHTKPRFGYKQPLGRLGLAEEIETTARQRSVGLFLRDHLDPNHTVLTPWPGAMGYLSRLPVIDLLGRATVPPGADHPRSWAGIPRVDVARALESRPDYIVPSILRGSQAPRRDEIRDAWVSEIDLALDERNRLVIGDRMRDYELIAVPIPFGNANRPRDVKRPFYLLRSKDLELAPTIQVEVEQDGLFRVEAVHNAHEQIVDLRILVRDAQDAWWSMRPTGQWEADRYALARTSLVLYPASKSIELARGVLPSTECRQLVAVLRTPGAAGERAFANASAEARVSLR